MKKMINRVTRFPVLDRPKTTKSLGHVELENKTSFKGDRRGMNINDITNMEIKFGIHIIAHKIYIYIRLNNFQCEAVDLAFKVVKKNLSFNLVELHLS